MLEGQVGQFLLVELLHLLDDGVGYVDVGDVLEAVFVHFLGEPGVATADVEDLEGGLNILSNDILYSTVPLIPVKRLLVPKQPVNSK